MSTELTFRDARARLRLRQEEFARRLGINRSYLSSLENGRKIPSEKLTRLLHEIWEREALTANAGTAPLAKDIRAVPVVSWARAGSINSYEEIPPDWQERVPTNCPDDYAFGLILEGDSMEPQFRQGDVVIAMPTQRVRSTGLVVARLKDRGVRFKILTIRVGQQRPYHLSSYNADSYPTEEFREGDFDWIYPTYEMWRRLWH